MLGNHVFCRPGVLPAASWLAAVEAGCHGNRCAHVAAHLAAHSPTALTSPCRCHIWALAFKSPEDTGPHS